MNLRTPTLFIASAGALLLACAHTAPRELVDARAAYARAADGPAKDHTPAELHVARDSLIVAERAFTDDGDTVLVRDQAYIAQRKAELAEALARTEMFKKGIAAAGQQEDLIEKKDAAHTKSELAKTKVALSTQQRPSMQLSPPNITYSSLLLVAGTACLFVAVAILQSRKTAVGATSLILLLLALAWWDTTYAIFWAGTPGLTKYFWLDITYLGAVSVPTALFVFSMQITNHQGWLKRPFVSLLYLEPILVLTCLFTDPYHGLFFAGRRAENSAVILDAGPVFWLNVVYSYSLILIATILIVRGYLRSSGVYRRQLGVILLGIDQSATALHKLFQQLGIRVVHAHWLPQHIIAGHLRKLGYASVWHIHGNMSQRRLYGVGAKLNHLLARWGADLLIPVSNFIGSNWKGSGVPIRVIHNAAPTLFAGPKERCDDQIRCVIAGRLTEDKGHHLAIQAVLNARAAGHDVRLDLFGGPLDRNPYVDDLNQLVSRSHAAQYVRFMGFADNLREQHQFYDLGLQCRLSPEP